MKEPKIGKWKINNYAKAIGIIGGLVLAGFGWHWTDELSNWYLLVCALGVGISVSSFLWTATDKSTRDDTTKGSAS